MYPKHCRYVSCAKWNHPRPIFRFVYFRPVPVVFRPEKVVKIRQKHLSTVLTGNDKNHTWNSVDMFQVRNQVISVRFTTFPALVLFGPEKVIKIRIKYFLVLRTGNNKNCTWNSVRIFWLQNRLIRDRFSSLPPAMMFVPGIVVKIRLK